MRPELKELLETLRSLKDNVAWELHDNGYDPDVSVRLITTTDGVPWRGDHIFFFTTEDVKNMVDVAMYLGEI